MKTLTLLVFLFTGKECRERDMTRDELGSGRSVQTHYWTSGVSRGNTCVDVQTGGGVGENSGWSLLPAGLAAVTIQPLLPLAHVNTAEMNEDFGCVTRVSFLQR